MKTRPESVFDHIADAYYSLTPTIPQQYTQLIIDTFNITKQDAVIDLGCGSGDLALAIGKYAGSVEGLDISKSMIDMATQKDTEQQVTWIQEPIEAFDLGEEKYNLIITFDSFHLFSQQTDLIKRCATALKPGGFLCIGWVVYAFDIPLRHALEETFASHGIPWNDWGAWTCPALPEQVKEATIDLSPTQKKTLEIPAKVSAEDILHYNFNVSKTASLSNSQKEKLSQTLWQRITEIFPTGESIGYDQYSMVYCQKRN